MHSCLNILNSIEIIARMCERPLSSTPNHYLRYMHNTSFCAFAFTYTNILQPVHHCNLLFFSALPSPVPDSSGSMRRPRDLCP